MKPRPALWMCMSGREWVLCCGEFPRQADLHPQLGGHHVCIMTPVVRAVRMHGRCCPRRTREGFLEEAVCELSSEGMMPSWGSTRWGEERTFQAEGLACASVTRVFVASSKTLRLLFSPSPGWMAHAWLLLGPL